MTKDPRERCDVVVIGGGPAGLSAAVVLGRACRSVVVVDSGRPRNYAAASMHNFLTRDGINPRRFRQAARAEAKRFGVQFISGSAQQARCVRQGFEVRVAGARLRSRKLIIATGVVDELPCIPRFDSFYGRSVHHCPYCDGWQWRGRRIAAYGAGRDAAGLALALRGWTDDIVALTDGKRLSPKVREVLERHQIVVHESRVRLLRGRKGLLREIVLEDGSHVRCEAMFFNTGQFQRSPLPALLGCEIDPRGGVRVDRRARTRVPGLFVVGDALKQVQFVVSAAAEGARAAVAVCVELQRAEGRTLRDGPAQRS